MALLAQSPLAFQWELGGRTNSLSERLLFNSGSRSHSRSSQFPCCDLHLARDWDKSMAYESDRRPDSVFMLRLTSSGDPAKRDKWFCLTVNSSLPVKETKTEFHMKPATLSKNIF